MFLRALALGVAAIVVLLAGALPATANTSGTGVVISQVYGGGGNSGSTYTNDFIELYNPTASAVPLTGWSVQYAATTGTNWQKTDLAGSIPAGGYYLVQEAQGAGGTTPLPTPNATGTIAMAAGAGKVVLLNTNTLTTRGHGLSVFARRPRRLRHRNELLRGRRARADDQRLHLRSAGGQRRDRHRQQRKRLRDRRAQPAELGHRSEPLDRRRRR